MDALVDRLETECKASGRVIERIRKERDELEKALRAVVEWCKASGTDRTPSGGVGALRYEGTIYGVFADARALLKEYDPRVWPPSKVAPGEPDPRD